MIGIVDYGVGNIKAFANIYKNLDIPYKVVQNIDQFDAVSKLILPGVGSFDHAMTSLQNSGMREMLDELVLEKKMPLLGVCIGLQMLAKSSEEGELEGLGWIDAVVRKFDRSKLDNNMPLPHMGWNSLDINQENTLVNNLDNNARLYFLHSYFIACTNERDVVASANYGENFAAIIKRENIYGIQPHPEKSHANGMALLKNFGKL